MKTLAAQVVALRTEPKVVPQAELAEQALELAARMTTREDASPLNEALHELCAVDQGMSQRVNHDPACVTPAEITTTRGI